MKIVVAVVIWAVVFGLQALARYTTETPDISTEFGIAIVIALLVLWLVHVIWTLDLSKPDKS